ncbi:MAG: hypothetical protein L0G80_18895 [Shewanella sp.]|uniref:hypothetical protein n=1 Tax=Shewanella sp. TaxID=50422 RepID=UPI0026470EB4|nr:hypothetical protein [Shewanella sp.]MDN5501973.1 hypothetical protein [Shewanella sp.]MDN5529869.1 hypothetical protein [Shewanella sp.]
MCKSRCLFILLSIFYGVCSFQVEAKSEEEVGAHLIILHTWMQVSNECTTKAPVALQQTWSVMSGLFYFEIVAWENKYQSQARFFDEYMKAGKELSQKDYSDVRCDESDKNYLVKEMVSDPMYEIAKEAVLAGKKAGAY